MRRRQSTRGPAGGALPAVILGFLLVGCGSREPSQAYLEAYNRAKTLYLSGDTAGALAGLENLERKDGSRHEGLILSGKIQFFGGNFAIARDHFERAARAAPGNVDALKWLARSQIVQRDLEAGRKTLQRALAISSEDIELLLLFGRLEEDQGNIALSLEMYNRVLLGKNHVAEAAINLARIYASAGMVAEARRGLTLAHALIDEESSLRNQVTAFLAELDRASQGSDP